MAKDPALADEMSVKPAAAHTGNAPKALPYYRKLVPRGEAATLLGLMVVSSMIEGSGLLMLIPIAQNTLADGVTQASGWAPAWFRALSLSQALGIFVILVGLRATIQYAVSIRTSRVVLTATETLRRLAQTALMAAEWRWLAWQDSAILANLIVSQSERIANHLLPLFAVSAGIVTAIVLSLTASALAPVFTAAVVAVGLLVALPVALLRSRSQSDGEAFVAASAALHRLVANGTAHLRSARIADVEPWLERAFDRAAADVRATEMRFERRVAFARASMQVLAAIALAALVYSAVAGELVPLAVLLPVLAIFIRLVPIALTMQQARRSWQFAAPAVVEMEALIAGARAEREDRHTGGEAPRLTRQLKVCDLSYRAPDRDGAILDDVTFAIPAGSVVSLSGPSGSGKSTLADLLSGLLTPDGGTISIDDGELSGPQRSAWRSRVAYVEQHPFLWPGTIRENLIWGRTDIGQEELRRALDLAAADFVNALEGGLDFRLADMGRPLSGGERQRLSFARAFLRRPDLLIVDEALASLNPDLRRQLLDNIRAVGVTTLLVNHDEPVGIDIDLRIALPGR